MWNQRFYSVRTVGPSVPEPDTIGCLERSSEMSGILVRHVGQSYIDLSGRCPVLWKGSGNLTVVDLCEFILRSPALGPGFPVRPALDKDVLLQFLDIYCTRWTLSSPYNAAAAMAPCISGHLPLPYKMLWTLQSVKLCSVTRQVVSTCFGQAKARNCSFSFAFAKRIYHDSVTKNRTQYVWA